MPPRDRRPRHVNVMIIDRVMSTFATDRIIKVRVITIVFSRPRHHDPVTTNCVTATSIIIDRVPTDCVTFGTSSRPRHHRLRYFNWIVTVG